MILREKKGSTPLLSKKRSTIYLNNYFRDESTVALNEQIESEINKFHESLLIEKKVINDMDLSILIQETKSRSVKKPKAKFSR